MAGIYLALATYGFGVLLELLIYPTHLMFETGHITTAPRPIVGPFDARDDKTFFFVALGLFVIALVAIEAARRARLGRLLRALADSPLALAAQGCSVNITRVAVFALAAFLAGIGGAVIVSQNRFLVSDPFSSTNSLLLVVLVLTFRVAEPFAAVPRRDRSGDRPQLPERHRLGLVAGHRVRCRGTGHGHLLGLLDAPLHVDVSIGTPSHASPRRRPPPPGKQQRQLDRPRVSRYGT